MLLILLDLQFGMVHLLMLGVPTGSAFGGNGYCNNVPYPVGANGSDSQMQYGTQI